MNFKYHDCLRRLIAVLDDRQRYYADPFLFQQ